MTGLRIHILVFAITRTVLNTMHRMIYPFLAVFARGLGVDLTVISLALTIRSAVGIFGPFLASLSDSRGRKTGMLAGLLLFSLGAGLVAVWPSMPAFFIALILTMLGKYTFDPTMQAYVGDQVHYRQRGLVMAITEMGWSFSFILGVPLMGLLIAHWGWSAPFPLLAGLGLLAVVIMAWMLPKDPPRAAARPGLLINFKQVFTYLPALAGLSMSMLISASNEVVNLVFGVWMEDAFSLKIATLGAASAVIGLSELGGETLVGVLADRMGKPRAVGVGIVLNGLAALALPFLGRTFPGALVGLFLFYITFEFSIVSAIPLMTEILPPARATLMAVNVAGHSSGRALGALLAAPLYAHGILASAFAVVGFNLLALLALRLLRQRSEQELEGSRVL